MLLATPPATIKGSPFWFFSTSHSSRISIRCSPISRQRLLNLLPSRMHSCRVKQACVGTISYLHYTVILNIPCLYWNFMLYLNLHIGIYIVFSLSIVSRHKTVYMAAGRRHYNGQRALQQLHRLHVCEESAQVLQSAMR